MTLEHTPVFRTRSGCVIAGAASFLGHACNARGAVIGGRLGTDPTGDGRADIETWRGIVGW
jgi:hypothetical protein